MSDSPARKAWLEANRERLRAYHREWSAANKDKIRQYAANADPAKKREMARKRMAKWRQEHPDEVRERSRIAGRRALASMTPEQKKLSTQRSREWKKAHPVETSAAIRRYTEKHLERIREKGRQYVARNPERIARNSREWRQANPDKHMLKEQRRRARIREAPGDGVTGEQWRELRDSYLGMCAYCYRRGVPLTMDHIDPLSRGGAHDVSNIAPACQSCNASKHKSTLIVWFAKQKRRVA